MWSSGCEDPSVHLSCALVSCDPWVSSGLSGSISSGTILRQYFLPRRMRGGVGLTRCLLSRCSAKVPES